jgi:hypothetical protein
LKSFRQARKQTSESRRVIHLTPNVGVATDTYRVRLLLLADLQRATPRRREMDVTDDKYPLAQPRAEQFDALVRELYPKIRQLSPHLSAVEALRAATRMAEYRMDDEATLMWGVQVVRR